MKKTRGMTNLLLAVSMTSALLTGCSGGAAPQTAVTQADGETVRKESDRGTGQVMSQSADSSGSSQISGGQSDGSENKTVVDITGREVTMAANVTKVAALVHPSCETVMMLGAQDQVVLTGGNGQASKGWAHVVCPEYADIPVMEDPTSPNMEELIESGAEVVFFWDSYPEVIKALEDAGMSVVITQVSDDGIDSAEEFVEFKKHEIMQAGEVFGGEALEKAKKWCAYVDEKVAYVTERIDTLEELERPTVYYVRGPEALTIHGGESYTRYLVDLAGGRLVSRDDPKVMYDTTMEQVMEWDPEYIFMGRVDNTLLITEDPAWAPIKAVKDGNIYVNLKGVFATDYSTDCFLLMEQIAQFMHPDLFEDLDMVQEVKEYYSEFYGCQITDEQANRILSSQAPEE